MQNRPWLIAVAIPAALSVALLASHGNANPLSHTPASAYTRILADSGGGGNTPPAGSGSGSDDGDEVHIGTDCDKGSGTDCATESGGVSEDILRGV